jgi:hypothetical protein
VADCPSSDVGLGYLLHVYSGLSPCNYSLSFQGVLEGQGVNDGGQHSCVISGGAVHVISFGCLSASPEVAASNYNGNGDSQFGDPFDLPGDTGGNCRVDAEGRTAAKSLTAELE